MMAFVFQHPWMTFIFAVLLLGVLESSILAIAKAIGRQQ